MPGRVGPQLASLAFIVASTTLTLHADAAAAAAAVAPVAATEEPAAALQPEELAADDACLSSESGEERCALNALQRRGLRITAARASVGSAVQCASIDAPENAACRKVVKWAGASGKNDPNAKDWYSQMKEITGVDFDQGSTDDFQRLFFCSPPGGDACGSPPCHCSRPPCDKCFGSAAAPKGPARAGCSGPASNTSIHCAPPKLPMDYKGMAWPSMSLPGKQEMHIFAIGDWGGMDGSLNPIEGRHPVVAYTWGKRPGPSVFPRTRWNLMHTEELCGHKQFVECYNTRGAPPCAEGCGYVKGVDDQPQILVAQALKARAAAKNPQFLLNVGDNFYWGGIEKTCGTPMDEISFTAHHQFTQIYENIYNGPGLDGKPWFSVLGNHDWGGRVFNNGWDQQIAYTWASDRWVLPAPYYSLHVDYPDQDFSVDIFFMDSNVMDAEDPAEDPEHNICGKKHNPPDADCSASQGPSSIETCPSYFQQLWSEQESWVTQKLAASKADWQLIVTHFPCGHKQPFYRQLYEDHGLDLLVTGHRHDQELWYPEYHMNHMGGLVCFVTGGGGGISSEATPDPLNQTDWYGEGEYGFYDLTINGSMIVIESINYNGSLAMTHVLERK